MGFRRQRTLSVHALLSQDTVCAATQVRNRASTPPPPPCLFGTYRHADYRHNPSNGNQSACFTKLFFYF